MFVFRCPCWCFSVDLLCLVANLIFKHNQFLLNWFFEFTDSSISWVICLITLVSRSNTVEWWMFMLLIFTHRYDVSVQLNSVKMERMNLRVFSHAHLRDGGLCCTISTPVGGQKQCPLTPACTHLCFPRFQLFLPRPTSLAAGRFPVSWYTSPRHTGSGPWPQTLHCITVASQTPQNKKSDFWHQAAQISCHQKQILWWKCRKTGLSPLALDIFLYVTVDLLSCTSGSPLSTSPVMKILIQWLLNKLHWSIKSTSFFFFPATKMNPVHWLLLSSRDGTRWDCPGRGRCVKIQGGINEKWISHSAN